MFTTDAREAFATVMKVRFEAIPSAGTAAIAWAALAADGAVVGGCSTEHCVRVAITSKSPITTPTLRAPGLDRASFPDTPRTLDTILPTH